MALVGFGIRLWEQRDGKDDVEYLGSQVEMRYDVPLDGVYL